MSSTAPPAKVLYTSSQIHNITYNMENKDLFSFVFLFLICYTRVFPWYGSFIPLTVSFYDLVKLLSNSLFSFPSEFFTMYLRPKQPVRQLKLQRNLTQLAVQRAGATSHWAAGAEGCLVAMRALGTGPHKVLCTNTTCGAC